MKNYINLQSNLNMALANYNKREDNMNKKLISQVFALIIIIISLIIMIGLIFQIPILLLAISGYITIKFITALCFFLIGLMLFLISKKLSNFSELVVPMCSFLVLLLMFTLLLSFLIGIKLGIEDLFIKESPGAVQTLFPGLPSMFTMIAFILIAPAGFVVIFDYENKNNKFLWLAIFVTFIGSLAFLGYLIQKPLLYYTLMFSNPMALITAVLFIFAGISLILLREKEQNKEGRK